MAIVRATRDHLPQLIELLHQSRTRFLHCGEEDIPDLVASSVTVLALPDEQASLSGWLAIRVEERPPSLPTSAPQRAQLVSAVLAPNPSSSRNLVPLLAEALGQLAEMGSTFQVVVQGPEPWMTYGLTATGFVQVEQVCYYQHTRHATPSTPQPAQLRSVQRADLDALAKMDAETFTPLWHMDSKELAMLLLTCRMQIALQEQQIVGYSALMIPNSPGVPARESRRKAANQVAFLARLAVHPRAQGLGIGRQLLADCLAYSHDHNAYVIQLNTQASNHQSQSLYESMGFRPMSRCFPVFARLVQPDAATKSG